MTLIKPIYVGFSILELSKLLVYKFHYDYVCNNFSAKLLFTDTGSLVYEINNNIDSVYQKCFKDKHLFGLSGYPKKISYYDILSKKSLRQNEG